MWELSTYTFKQQSCAVTVSDVGSMHVCLEQ
jgi:hypothetical protein